MERARLDQLLQTENLQLQKLNELVLKSIEEEKLISHKAYEPEEKNARALTADRIAAFVGSWYFIFIFILVLALWVVLNLFWIVRPFDPYPFIFLNLLLSTLAAIQAPIIMMSQNRIAEKDRRRAVNDYLVNLKAEIEIRNLQRKMDFLVAEQMKTLFEIQDVQLQMMDELKTAYQSAGRKPLSEPENIQQKINSANDNQY